MADADGKHVFISYVREDSEGVDALCAVLEAAQIPYWRDRSALGPGDAWKVKIREAIRKGALVFLACFSDSSRGKDRSYMNEELTLAAEEFRMMPPGRTWLIPIRFDDGDVPPWDLGAGRMLSDLNYSDLFGPTYTANATRLVTTILRLTGEKRPDSATALAAVEQATHAGRADLLKRLTKEMLLDPARRIELDDLVSHEVQRVMAALSDADRVAGPFGGSNDERVVQVAQEAQDLWSLAQPFCASLQVAARWGTADLIAPWANGLRSFVAAANKIQSGVQPLLEVRHLPGMVGIVTATLAAASSRKWDNVKTLVVDPTVRDRYEQKPLPILDVTDPYKPFATDEVSNTLARAAISGRDPEDALKDFTERRHGKYHTPVAEWLHHIVRPLFLDQWPDQDTYDAEFDRAEVILGVLAQDVVNVRAAADPSGHHWGRSHWYGRSTWRFSHHHGNPVEELTLELSTHGKQWDPLQANLFGGDEGRAQKALSMYGESFLQIARHRW
ncbi:toll/interleukin-1 receptor domain-containing protein [Blastococcus haudaquaticus]|nr:toll/interleukin-1 receptor domain-containing protein [Blastococcus haudaquaticus]